MKKKLSVTVKEEGVRLSKGGFSDDSQLSVLSKVRFCGTFGTPIGNRITVSKELYDRCRGDVLVLYAPDSDKFLEVSPYPSDNIGNGIKTSVFIRNELELSADSSPILLTSRTARFTTIKKQRVEDLKSELIEISAADARAFGFTSGNFSIYRVRNYYTGENITVKSSHIKVNESLKSGEIRLQKRQRTFLGLEVPRSISDDFWREITDRMPDSDNSDMNVLSSAYTAADHFLKDDITHETKERVKEIISKYCPQTACISPVLGSFKTKMRRSFLRVLSDFYVGKATTALLCRRPYESDEGSDVVRMSLSNMNLLGVSEMDKIVITHNNVSVKCRVLKLDDSSAFLETNVPTPVNFAICIPAHVRRKLGIYDLNTSVKVDRDTGFIFAKSINEQVVPIILTVFSINFLTDPALWIKTLISVAAIPIVVFFNLSSKRNMRNQ